MSRVLCWKCIASGVALAGLLAVLTACQDLKATLGSKHHYLLYCLATAMKPRMLLTLDAEGSLLSVPVRLGQAVDVVAQAGRPKTITGARAVLTVCAGLVSGLHSLVVFTTQSASAATDTQSLSNARCCC